MRSREEVSAGGVVYRRTPAGIEVLICRTSTSQKWVIPKGLIDPGERVQQTAVREVREEVGVNARIIMPLDPAEHYIFTRENTRIYKTVHYFLMEYVSGNEADHDHEMELVMWVPLDQAIEMVAYDSARSVLQRAKAKLEAIH
ncbi:MAG: NUDIX hydrolase [Anaerolineae bacterium]|nr:NUDIX hydrolase [Anaerolineae bacterium]